MNWLLLAFLAPLLWAISNFIDKFFVSKYFKSKTGTLVLYSCFSGLPVALCIVLFKPQVLDISLLTALFILLNGMLYILFLFPYFKALSKADTSLVIPLFQMIPVFGYVLAFFVLGEVLSKMQLVASIFIILGAIGISLRFESKKVRLHFDVFFLMLVASLIISLNSLLFKFFALELDFWTVSFWQYAGFVMFGVLTFTVTKSYRQDFLASFQKNGKKIVSLNMVNETINILAVMALSYATLLTSLSLVWVITGFQPLFVFLIGILLTVFTPHLVKETINRKIVVQKIFFMIIMIIGAYLIGS